MTPKQLKQREVLLARNDATLDRWPKRTGPEFIREMTAVLQGLEALAREADAVVGDRLERCRTWRYVGNAYFDLGAGRDLAQLKHAADAYQRAEALLEGLDDPIERMKLDYSYGNALFHLCDAQDLQLAQEARRRYASALAIARVHMPAGVESAQSALTNAEMVVALLHTASDLSDRIAELKEDLGKPDSAPAPAQSQDIDWMGMFEELRDVYNKDVEAGKVTETRKQALDPVLEQLQDILQNPATDLTGMTSQGQSVRDLMGSMEPLLHKTSQPAAPAAGSRADQVWQRFSRLKTYLARDLSRPHMGSEERFYGVELYKRCGYADTYLHQQERDDATVWGSAPQPQDPSAVFFSGGNALRRMLAEVCEGLGLKLLAQTMPKDFAATRWDQLRRSHVAVFDYTTYVRPDLRQTSELAVTGPIAAVSYELGIALTLGQPIIVVAKDDQDLPFDVDIEPVRLRQDGLDRQRLAETIDDAMYGLQWGGGGSSIAATRAYLQQAFSGHENFVVSQSLKLIDDVVARDRENAHASLLAYRRARRRAVGQVAAPVPGDELRRVRS